MLGVIQSLHSAGSVGAALRLRHPLPRLQGSSGTDSARGWLFSRSAGIPVASCRQNLHVSIGRAD